MFKKCEDENMPMIDDIKSLDYDRVRAALQRDEDPNQLFAASIRLYSKRGSVTGHEDLWMTPLLYAIDKGREDIAALLIDNRAQSDVVHCSESALNHACKKGMFRIAKMLLEKGARTDRADFLRETLLMSVIYASHLARAENSEELTVESLDALKDMLHALQQYGVNLDPVGNVYDENNPLFVAACQLKDKGLVGVLLELGASIQLTNGQGRTLLERLYEAEVSLDEPPLAPPVLRRTYAISVVNELPNNTLGIPAGFCMLSHILDTLSSLDSDDQIEQAKNNLEALLYNDAIEAERKENIVAILERYLGCQQRLQTQIKEVGGGAATDAALSHVHILDFLTRREQHHFSATSKTKKVEKKRSHEEMDTKDLASDKKTKVAQAASDHEAEMLASPKEP